MAAGGFEIVIASSGEQAIEFLSSSEEKFRALVTDINLGRNKFSGWEVARHAREINPDFPVVYMSGDSAEDWNSRGVPHSIMLGKPFAPAQLVTAVSQLLNSGTPANEGSAARAVGCQFVRSRRVWNMRRATTEF